MIAARLLYSAQVHHLQAFPEIQTALISNFTDDQWARVKTFYMQSGLRYEEMGLKDKAMMAMFRTMLKAMKGHEEESMAVSGSFDATSKEFIKPLVEYCRG